MPSVKQGGGYTLTFSKKNQDVKKILANIKEEDKIKITDYICEAVRFYEKNKKNRLDSELIDPALIDRMIEDKIKILIGTNLNFKQDYKLNTVSLEDNLDSVNDDDLEED